jgi:serine/threonine protein kinase
LYSSTRRCWTISDFRLTSPLTDPPALTENARGTDGYRAPELLEKQSWYSKKVDIWALGCVAFEIVTRRKAFASDFEVFRLVKEDADANIPSLNNLGNGWSFWRRVLLKMLQVREAGRPSANTLHAEFRTQLQKLGTEKYSLPLTV